MQLFPLARNRTPTGGSSSKRRPLRSFKKLIQASPTAASTLMYMVNHMSRSNALVVSQAAIAKGIGAKRESVNRAVRYLVEHNFIQVIKAAGASVYVVNSRVMWQGNRGERYAAFGADIVAIESEQDPATIEQATPLKCVPRLVEGERLLVGNEPIDPPDQGELELP